MEKNRISKSSTAGERKTTKAIGHSKAIKFAAVEGMKLSAKSSRQLSQFKADGLRGDALRSAISGAFKKK